MDAMSGSTNRVVATAVTLGLFFAICGILRARSPRVVVMACGFVGFLVATQLIMKVLCGPTLNYKFPGLVTVLHFSCVVVICWVYWGAYKREPRRCLPTSIGWRRYARNVLPIALSTPISVVFNNKAMVFVGAGVVAIIGTLAPIATAVLSRAFGRQLSWLSWGGVLVAFGGGVVISWSEVNDVGTLGGSKAKIMTGLTLAFLAVFGRSAKIVMLDNMMNPDAYVDGAEHEEPLPPLQMYALQFPLATALALAYSLATEDIRQAWEQLTPEIVGVIVLSMCTATALNFLGLHVLKEFGATAQQIIGKLNTICIAAISVAYLGEHLPWPVLLGSCLVLCGVAIFERGTEQPPGDKVADGREDEQTFRRLSDDGKHFVLWQAVQEVESGFNQVCEHTLENCVPAWTTNEPH